MLLEQGAPEKVGQFLLGPVYDLAAVGNGCLGISVQLGGNGGRLGLCGAQYRGVDGKTASRKEESRLKWLEAVRPLAFSHLPRPANRT